MASSSTSFHSASGSSSLLWSYDVFLSFRGEDTRKTFVDHLHTRLVEHGIHTYKDDTTLARGESIGPALLKAIRESKIAIIVFSENYADSSWCLDELVYIMKCKNERGQIVLPVFYHVDPSDVRKQKRKYEEAFVTHELKNNNKVESWRKALFDAGNLSGWVPNDIANGHESKLIKCIVDTVSKSLFSQSSDVNEDLIGMSSRLKALRSHLEHEVGGVRMIGIWGMGGGGKTTLASAIYAEISSKFDGCCFLENIREKSNKCGLDALQEKILSDILKGGNMKVGRVDEGRNMIRNRLRDRKVLIVLDDVDHLDQLRMLAGSNDWFGKGSRIIITTRDKHLLNAHKVDVIHDNKLLNDDEATKLFCKHAPQQVYMSTKDYEALLKDVVSYAHGLPLALKVLGSFLCDKDVNEWKSALMRLKDIPEDDIIGKLRISYDGLKPLEKELFLDIACFHRGGYVEEAMTSLDACGFHPVIGLKVLIEKALVTVSKSFLSMRCSSDSFDMHDLIQEIGHYIVQGENPANPEKHSRVWQKKDLLSVCSMNTMNNDMIVAIDCEGYPSSLLPTNFQPTKLRSLILRESSLIQLWEGYKDLPNLKVLDISWSVKLIKTPDLGGLPSLERMILNHCSKLREIHPSTGCHERLTFLDLNGCYMLEVFPPIMRMPNLATLILSLCSSLFGFPHIHSNMNNLVDLCLVNEEIPFDICELSNLQVLDLRGNKFSRIHFNLVQLPRLKFLNISECKNLVALPDLPPSISIVDAAKCDSLRITEDFPTTYRWLWKVTLGKRVRGQENILRSMFQGNAINEDHFMSFRLSYVDKSKWLSFDISKWSFARDTFTLKLPWNWYSDYSGFLISVIQYMDFNMMIIIKQMLEIYTRTSSSESDVPKIKSMCYIPFGSLMQKPLWNGHISFFIRECEFKVELVPRRSKGGSTKRSTDCSEFWDEQEKAVNTFTVRHASGNSVEITWLH